jgi:hypothetical protein
MLMLGEERVVSDTPLQKLLPEMREGHYRVILVSGVQRSGTHIMSRILAEELDYIYMSDTDYDVKNNQAWCWMVLDGKGLVIHCPHMSHFLQFAPPDVAVVYMKRPIDEVTRSFTRVNPPQAVQASNPEQGLIYGLSYAGKKRLYSDEWIILRNKCWDDYQHPRLKGRGYTFQYHDLKEHRLFSHNRKEWTMNQTEQGEE